MWVRQAKERVSCLAATDLDFPFNEARVFETLNRYVCGFCVAGEQFGRVAFLVRVTRSSQKHARTFVFESRRGEYALAHRFLAQAGEERISVLSLDERSESARHRDTARFPLRKRHRDLLLRKQDAANDVTECVELTEGFGCACFVDDTGANRIIVFKNEEENVILKAEQVATHVRLAGG